MIKFHSSTFEIVHNFIYGAWSAYDGQALSTTSGADYRRPEIERTLVNKEEAVSYAAYRSLVNLFPSQKSAFDTVMIGLGYDPNNVSTDLTTAVGIGNSAGKAIIDFRSTDGSNQDGSLSGGLPYSDYTGYTPVNTPTTLNDLNHWQPLDVGGTVQEFQTPFFGQVTPFALTAYDQFDIPDPIFYDPDNPLSPESQAFVAQTQEAIDFSANLTGEQKTIAEYWADGPSSELPPGHWNDLSHFISERDNHTIDDDAKLYFALNGAVFDAGIAAWGFKEEYDYVRPVTAVQTLFERELISAWAGPDQGTQFILGEDYLPYQSPGVVTPPFAEYVSGHSTFSSAAAAVLREFTPEFDS